MRCLSEQVLVSCFRGVATICRVGGSNWFQRKRLVYNPYIAYVQDFGVYATQTEDALVAVERTCLSHCLDIFVSVVIDVHQRQPRLSLA